MKFLVVLVLWAQVLSCKAIPLSPPFILPIPKVVNCDDAEAENVALIARDYINSHSLHGYKYELNRIEKIKMIPRRPHGDMYFLELDLLETTCHVLNPLPIENCTLRGRHEHAVEGDCDVKMLSVDGKVDVLSARCHSKQDSAEDLSKLCPDCPQLTKLDNADVVRASENALAEFNSKSTCYYKLLEISRAMFSPMPAGVHVEFAIAGTNCTAEQAKEHVENCHVESGEHAHYGFCKASVINIPEPSPEGVKLMEKRDVACEVYEDKPGPSHTHLTVHHLGGNRPSPGVGFHVLDLVHSHNGTHASHESHSAEQLVPPAPPAPAVVKRAVVAEEPLPALPVTVTLPICPGKTRHFHI